jgi:sigma-B regulation protein RsbU (phosphoserine phosphatase)
MAKSVQQAIIPKQFTGSDKFEIAGQYIPMQNLGGDYYDVYQFNENKLAFTMVDVSGHGISAALITTMAKMSFASLAKEYNPPFFILDQMNKSIYSSIGTSGMFLTAFYGIIDLELGKMIYSSGGHNAVQVLRKNGTIDSFRSLNTLVGLFPEEEYISSDTEIASGDTVICYTDGIIESKSEKGEFFGLEKLNSIIQENSTMSPGELSEFVIQQVNDHIGPNREADDDLSILIIRIQ